MSTEKEERIERLCSGFALLEERDQEYIFGVLQALLFAKKRVNENKHIAGREEKGEKID
jgi:hypothetical protein